MEARDPAEGAERPRPTARGAGGAGGRDRRSAATWPAAWAAAIAVVVGVRVWNALAGPVLHGYDAWAHVAYVLFLDTFHALPRADQGWSFFHPPLYYLVGLALAQSGSADVLARGLALWSSAASAGAAACTALAVRAAVGRGEDAVARAAPLVAFVAVGLLPVHVYTSPMPGNETTAAFFATATVALYAATARRTERRLALDAAIGALGALALLSKFNGALALGTVFVVALARALRAPVRAAAVRDFARSAATVGVVAVVVAGPWYARNLAAYGTPFQTSHAVPEVAAQERTQPPGERGLRDFVALPGPAALLADSRFDAPHVVHSVWGTLYLNLWFDTFRGGQFPKLVRDDGPWRERPIHVPTIAMALVGAGPSALVIAGAFAAARCALRDRDAVLDACALVLVAAGLAAFAVFAVRVPTFAAVKASYLLNLSLAWGWLTVRGLGLVRARLGPWAARAALAWVACAGAASAAVFTSGLLFPMERDHADVYALRSYFGDADAARAWFTDPALRDMRWAIEEMAAIELAHGDAHAARALLRRVAGEVTTPRFVNALAVATALDGGARQALRMWDGLLGAVEMPEARINRALVRMQAGDLDGARRDLDAARARAPEVVALALATAELERRAGDGDAARAARARAEGLARSAPRGYPHGVGDGELRYPVEGDRWLLVADGDALALWRPARSRIARVSGSRGRAADAAAAASARPAPAASPGPAAPRRAAP